MFNKLSIALLTILVLSPAISEMTLDEETLNYLQSFEPLVSNLRKRCPVCDSSVYSYCGDKLFHDSCCCTNSNNPYYPLPVQCKFVNCNFLHANSCQEHKLISACCCIH